MPPRRKKAAPNPNQDTEVAVSTVGTRATRSSARQKDAAPSTTTVKPAATTTRKRKAVGDGKEEEKTTKRARGAKAAIVTPAKSDDGDEDGINDSAAGPSKSKAKATPSPAVQVQSPNELFNAYADAEEPDMMGAEGLERLCAEGDIPMDGARPLLLAWELDAKELGVFTREEWTKGLDTLQVKNLQSLAIVLVDLENLLILRKTPPARPATQSISKNIKSKSSLPIFDKYNKDRYWGIAANVEAAYLKFYNFCFALVKKSGSRNIDMEYASAFWSVILAPIYPMMTEIIEFINEKGTYKGVNKDLWSMMREFCRTVKPSLEGYDSDGAWPTLLDDFVEWKKTPKSATETEGASGAFA